MSIDLSDALLKIIQQRVAEGAYASATAYIEALVRDDQQRQANAAQGMIGLTDRDREQIGALLIQSLQSGSAMSVDSFLTEASLERVGDRRETRASGRNPS
jgi:Arc/MetJ-type ribon-helix-helix transcriptional regulator